MDLDDLIIGVMIVAVVLFVVMLLGYATYIILNAVTPYDLEMSWADILVVGAAESLVLLVIGGGDS
ncbi:MAG: hypothetical protein DRI61_12100 [Chloroflexi bacterium]|nr:MAG: hypothetical protein DRI61_12100 [Chloroflexota bacterium]